ncbi:MAG: DUF4292 domain-containing protein [Flavobacteriales bacterium]|jgi:hypothetical protein|tara:strand:+ start:2404 stop:3159 length:756 start_codon:yes stop_codon:yes gene_type:complete
MRKVLIFIPLLFLSCKALTKADTERSFKKISIKKLLKNISEEDTNYNYLFIRSKATIIKEGSTNQINLSIRIKNKEKILINGSLLIPLFKGLITEKKISFYEKINKTYYLEDYNSLASVLKFKLSLNSLENLFIGKPIEKLNDIDVSQVNDIDSYTLESKNKTVKITYSFNPFTFNLIEQKLHSIKTKNELTIEYGNYKTIENKIFPQKIKITAKGKEDSLRILLNLKISRIDQKLSFPFQIPKDYKKTEL